MNGTRCKNLEELELNGDCDEKVEPVIMDLEKYKKTMQKIFEKTHANYLEENPRKTSVNNDDEDE